MRLGKAGGSSRSGCVVRELVVAGRIVELFGYAPKDRSEAAEAARAECLCPWVGGRCSKVLHDGEPSGVCTLETRQGEVVVVCPNRLYEQEYRVLREIVSIAFGQGVGLVRDVEEVKALTEGGVAVFGRNWGKELRLPSASGRSGYFVDWILALVESGGELREFVAVEVQTIDTTGNYRDERSGYLSGKGFKGWSTVGLNWENVNKRILPQLIYKGHVLQREPLCRKGLFFVTPAVVYERIMRRSGDRPLEYPLQPGALTFVSYDVGPDVGEGKLRTLQQRDRFTTTVAQVAQAWISPRNLPEPRVYELAIRKALQAGLR